MTRVMRFHAHSERAAEKVKTLFYKFKSVAKARWGLQFQEMRELYRMIFIPMITYAAPVWTKYAIKADISKLEKAQRAVLLGVTRAYRTVSNLVLLIIANVER